MSEVTDLLNLTASLKRVISNGGSSGVDGMGVKGLKDWFSANQQELIPQLNTNSYRVDQVRGVKIPKPQGGYRQLGIPTVKDRLVQQSIHQVMERYYDPTFLGHSIIGKGELGLSKESMQRLKGKLKSKTRRNRGISLDQMIKELNLLMRGWLNYFKGARMKVKLETIMSWLRRRIRCFRLKQCKRAIGIARFLQKLKVPEWRSSLLALSSKGWYHKSNTPQANEGMNLGWFASIGLFDIYAYYCLNLMKPPST